MRRRALWFGLLCLSARLMAFEDGFVGHWENRDSHTRDVTSAEIRADGGEAKAHMWGACHPNPCDWGESALEGSGKTRHVQWTNDFSVREQTLKLAGGGQELHVKTHTHFTDHSGRHDYTTNDVLVRQP